MGRIKKFLLWLTVVILIITTYLTFGQRRPAARMTWGVSFSKPYAESLGLDWKAAYLGLLNDLKVSNLRLSSYWDEMEPTRGQINFDDLDFQVNQAAARGTKIILTLGMRQPRWPECHVPDWAQKLSTAERQRQALAQVYAVVQHYAANPAIEAWQVENEFFVTWFGTCPPPDPVYLDEEIALVKSLDRRPVVLTDSGEMSVWVAAASRADIFGTTMYRTVYGPFGKTAWPYPPVYYSRLGAAVQALTGFKKMIIAELQMEPWAKKTLLLDSTQTNFETFSPAQFDANADYARASGIDEAYLWGAEWWYYMKEKRNVTDYWDKARDLWKH